MRSPLRRAAASLAFTALLVLPASAPAAIPKPGHYSGTTEQGREISFDVRKKGEKRRVRDFQYSVEAPCESGMPIDAGGTLMGPARVNAKGKFSYSEVSSFSLEVRGKFDGKTSATGSLRYITLAGGGTVYCDSGKVSWEAERD
jgi:hypothetical protein